MTSISRQTQEWALPMLYEHATRTRDELVSTNNTLPFCERCGIQMYAGMQYTCGRQDCMWRPWEGK